MIDNETGEVISEGISVITHEEKARRAKAKKDREEKEKIRRYLGDKYFFVRSDGDSIGSLSAANAARLIYLCTFSNYSGKLVSSERKPLLRGDLQEVLKLSKTATYDFLEAVCPEFMQIGKDESLHLNSDLLKRGRLDSKLFIPYQRFYDRGVRELYCRVGSRKHKHLGYVFLLLQYVNIEYNMLCHNPHEKELARVSYMTAGEFCEEIGYNPNNVGRLIQIYERITFWAEGKEEYFCTFNYREDDKINATVWINPNILYNGTRLDEVKLLGEFCKVRPHSAEKQHTSEKPVVMGFPVNEELQEKRKNA